MVKREDKNVSFGGGCVEGLMCPVLLVFWVVIRQILAVGAGNFTGGRGENRIGEVSGERLI